MTKLLLPLSLILLLGGCTTSKTLESAKNLFKFSDKDKPTAASTLETARQQINIRTSKNSVRAIMGDPLMIRRNANGEEVWAYDKIYIGARKIRNDRMSFLDMNGFEYVIGAGIGLLISNIGINFFDINKYNDADTYKKMLYVTGAGGGIALIDYLKDGGFKSYALKDEETLTILVAFRGDKVSRLNYHYSRF